MSSKKQPTKINSKARKGTAAKKKKATAKSAPAKATANGKGTLALIDAPRESQLAVMPPTSSDRQSSVEGRYVYGIIQGNQQATFGKTGMGGAGESVYSVHHGDVAAVVSKTSVFIFDPTRENALAHEHVIETVMK
ncbi:MAG: Gas vesicle synthesis GvpLGvpF, partial [Acidobacteriaceae bacterium]|nr:Gas vesicle synthesis GvpLGvpF [Acidobacteriaceae bacterium]